MDFLKAVVTALIAISVSFSSANARDNSDKITIKPTSHEGAMLMKVPNLNYQYTFNFSKDGKSGFGSRAYLIKVDPDVAPGEFRYVALVLRPGVYRLDAIYQQAGWGMCLQDGTFSAEIKSGAVMYVGTVDPRPVLANLQAQAVAKGETALGLGGLNTYWSNTSRPIVSGRSDDELVLAERFVKTSMPRTSAPTRLANINDVSFSVSKGNKAVQVCG